MKIFVFFVFFVDNASHQLPTKKAPLKVLHTSDWHLGQTLRGFDRAYEHQCFLDWLVLQIRTLDIDALLVSGDIFDNANPSSLAQKQLYRFLHAAREAAPALRIVLIAGNHDSAGRLEAPAPLLEVFETTVIGQTRRTPSGDIDLESLLVPLPDRQGRVDAWCLAVPFLRPGDVPRIETGDDPYLAGMAAVYRQGFELALSRREPGQALLALGHCHMAGGDVSKESERRIVIGGAEMLSAAIFDERLAYVALGHLHRPQAVSGKARIRYSGSPLPMSFAEIDYPHQVVLIELDGESAKTIEPLRVPRAVGMLRIPAQPAPLPEALEALHALALDDLPEEQWPYLEVRVRFNSPEPGARAAIEAALKDKPVRFAGIDASYRRSDASFGLDADAELAQLSQMQPEDILQQHYQTQYGEALPAALRNAFIELLIEPAEEAQ